MTGPADEERDRIYNNWSPDPFRWDPRKFRDWAWWQPNRVELLAERARREETR